jgi:uncharacterized membrane protein
MVMDSSLLANSDKGVPKWRIARLALISAIFVFVTYVGVKGFWSAFYNDDFPESLAVKVELLPFIFPLHMVTGAAALLLLPLAYSLRAKRRWHRLVGRIAAVDVLISGVTAYPVAWEVPVTSWSAAGFSAQASVWLVLLGAGIYNIRRGRVALHRACMLMMVATTSGAIFFRIFLGVWARLGDYRHFEIFYACDAWAAWMLPLTVTAWLVARHERIARGMNILSV